MTQPLDLPRTVGELRSSGHRFRTVKEELRENLLAKLRSGEPRFPGIVPQMSLLAARSRMRS